MNPQTEPPGSFFGPYTLQSIENLAFSPHKLLGRKRGRNNSSERGVMQTPTRPREAPESPTITVNERRKQRKDEMETRHGRKEREENDGQHSEGERTPRAGSATEDVFLERAPMHAEVENTVVEHGLKTLLSDIRDCSIHREWPDKIKKMAAAIAYRIVPEAFTPTAADPGLNSQQNNDLTRLTSNIERIAQQVSSIQARLDGAPYRNSGSKVVASTESHSDAKTSHARGPLIKPAPKTTHPQTKPNPPLPKNPLAAYHPSRLIVTIKDGPLGAGNRPSERDAVNAINERLAAADDSKHLRVVAVRFNEKSNCVVITREDQTAAELQQHEQKFLSVLAGPGATAKTLLDKPWYKIQINGVDTGKDEGKLYTSDEIWEELRLNNPSLEKVSLLHPPRWMRTEGDLADLRASSVVLAFRTESRGKAEGYA